MITILSRIFIRPDQMTAEQMRKACGTVCCVTGIFLNIVLFAGKFLAGTLSGSVAVRADAFNNFSDAGSSLISFIGFYLAAKKPDSRHPFGHGRYEYLSGLGVSLLILLMGLELAKDSFLKILHPSGVHAGTVTICVLAASILVKLYMAFYNARFGKKINSSALRATAVDSLCDAAATAVVLFSVLAGKYTHINTDGYCGLLVSLVILYAGLSVAKDTASPLIGQPPEAEFVNKVKNIALAHDGVCAIHDLIVHDYGPGRRMVTLHAEVPGDRSLIETHRLIDKIEHELHDELGCEAVIHMDPVDAGDRDTIDARTAVEKILSELDAEATLHDFHLLNENGQKTLAFDVLVPYSLEAEDDVISSMLSRRIVEDHIAGAADIHVDRQ